VNGVAKFTVIVTEPINEAGIRLLGERNVNIIQMPPGSKEGDLLKIVSKADGLITRGSIMVTREMMAASPQLKAIGVHGMGYDHVDIVAAMELGKMVFNTPDALTVSVAEMTLAMMLALTRKVVAADKAVRAGDWNRKYNDLIGADLAGRTVGLIGLGRIGAAVARRLKAFDVDLLYYSRTRRRELESYIGIEWAELDDLLSRSDVISLHVPGTSETYHMIGPREFDLMKQGVLIVNMARGRVIDQEALLDALMSDRVAGAALDVFEEEPLDPAHPLTAMDNVILTPHLGASSLEGMQRMATQVAQGVLDVLNGKEPQNRVV
jgi:D-3-phosphoglycerate dehydrogenase